MCLQSLITLLWFIIERFNLKVSLRGDNEPDQLVSYSDSVRSKLGSSKFDPSSGSARDLNEPSQPKLDSKSS
ncbi:hypothetical protein GQ457_07G004930 [Hibiscus cannabinus]